MEGGGGGELQSGGTFQFKKIYMAKWHHFRLFLVSHITKCSYIDTQSHQPALWWFPAGCLPGWASWSHLQTTRAPVDARQAREWGLSKSRLLKLWQWYKHELYLPNGGEKWDLKLCAYKTPFGKSSHEYNWFKYSINNILWRHEPA